MNQGGHDMKSLVLRHSIMLDGHKTSVALEDAFWSGLKEIADAKGITVSAMIAEIDKNRRHGNRSSAIRQFVLDHVRNGHRHQGSKRVAKVHQPRVKPAGHGRRA
jgi:predicted DNA-binding ribbon-helix-helix protein